MDNRVDSLLRDFRNLSQQHADLREEYEVLRDCLDAAGLLPRQRFLARLHRRHFQACVEVNPWDSEENVEQIMQRHELAFSIVPYAGMRTMKPVAAVSKAFRSQMDRVSLQLRALATPMIYVAGGQTVGELGGQTDGEPLPTATVERFNPVTGSWEEFALLNARRDDCAAVAAQGLVYVVGGSMERKALRTVERFDPQAGTVEQMPQMHSARDGVAAVAIDGMVYAVGGCDNLDSSEYLNTGERFDPASNSWVPIPSMHSARWRAAAVTADGKVYAIGGMGVQWEWEVKRFTVLNSVECLNPKGGQWEVLPPMHTPRWGAAAAAVDGKVYAIGGFDHRRPLRSVECFDPKRGVWTMLSPMATPRFNCRAIASGGFVYVFGGMTYENGPGPEILGSVERFNPVANVWEPLPQMRTARTAFAVAALLLWSDS